MRKIEEANDPTVTCITNHPGFKSVCLDVWVLQAAYFQYRQEHGTTSAPLSIHEIIIMIMTIHVHFFLLLENIDMSLIGS